MSPTKKLKEVAVEPEGPSPRQSARTKAEVKYYEESEKKQSPKKQRGKKVLPKPVPLEEEGEKAAEPPKAVVKRGKTAAPKEKKVRGGKKATAAANSKGFLKFIIILI